MQLSMFDTPKKNTKPVTKAITESQYDWRNTLRRLSQPNLQIDLISNVLPTSVVETYKSGSSAKTDLLGYMETGSNIGVCAVDASVPVLRLLAQYVSAGGKAFIDSGAFRNYNARRDNPSIAPLDFDKVFDAYDTVLDAATDTSTLILVAPDEVGQQTTSFGLLNIYQDKVRSIKAQGAEIMVPLQKGALSLSEHYKRCRQLLGFDFICGLPSNAKAVNSEEINEFLEDISPTKVHFLGTAESSLVHKAKFKSPSTQFSCDATLIRKHIGQNRLLTEMQTQIVDEAVGYVLHGRMHSRLSKTCHWDETEIVGDLVGYIESMNVSTLKRLAEALSTTVKVLKAYEENDALWRHIDDMNYGYAYQLVITFISKECIKDVSPKIRKSVVTELALLNII